MRRSRPFPRTLTCFTWNNSTCRSWRRSAASCGCVRSAEPLTYTRRSTKISSGRFMFGVADYGTFVGAILIFLAIPGPGNLALINSTGKGGVPAGLAATLGIIAGDQVLMWAAVAGVAALLAAYPAAFNAMQWVGAAYLTWLGIRMLLAKPGDAPVLTIQPRQYFRQATLITLLNPKAI